MKYVWCCLLYMSFVSAMLSVLFVICADMEELAACGNSDLNSSTEASALPMARRISSILSNCHLIFERNDFLKCFKIFSSDILIILTRTLSSYADCFTSCLLWMNLMLYQYVCCSLIVYTKELNIL